MSKTKFSIVNTQAYKTAMASADEKTTKELEVRSRVQEQYFKDKLAMVDLEMSLLRAEIDLEKASATSSATSHLRQSVDAIMADSQALTAAEGAVKNIEASLATRKAIFEKLYGVTA